MHRTFANWRKTANIQDGSVSPSEGDPSNPNYNTLPWTLNPPSLRAKDKSVFALICENPLLPPPPVFPVGFRMLYWKIMLESRTFVVQGHFWCDKMVSTIFRSREAFKKYGNWSIGSVLTGMSIGLFSRYPVSAALQRLLYLFQADIKHYIILAVFIHFP